jgi:hypothetical protein
MANLLQFFSFDFLKRMNWLQIAQRVPRLVIQDLQHSTSAPNPAITQLYLSEMQFDQKLYENKKDLPSVPLLTT